MKLFISTVSVWESGHIYCVFVGMGEGLLVSGAKGVTVCVGGSELMIIGVLTLYPLV